MPDEPFPAYSYVTGRFPHPTRDAAGHSFGVKPMLCEAPDEGRWRECRPYLFGLDLFNHGYYWEAHEVWESVWQAAGRTGVAADFFKGLIKLAAAGVKARERRPAGVKRHAQRAAELFRQVARQLSSGQGSYFGLALEPLIDLAEKLAGGSIPLKELIGAPVEVVFRFTLDPVER